MKNEKILIIGGSGLLGRKLKNILEENSFDVYTTFFRNKIDNEKNFFLDITQKEDVRKILEKIKPDVVVHTAAYTNVDDCERNKETALKINYEGTKNLAELAEKNDLKFVYVSTDYVFDGEKGMYKEEDENNPVNYYGFTKLEAENVVKRLCSNFLIARTSVIYGADKNNFALWCINNLKDGKSINIVDDQFISPTLNTDLSEQLVMLIGNDASGVFHTTGGQRISRYDFVMCLAEVFGFNKINIKPIRMSDMRWVAERPMDSSLDVSKVSKFKKPYKVHEALELLRKEMGG